MSDSRAGYALCKRCGNPAEGSAFIGDDRYCHGDTEDERGFTCYEAQSIHEAQLGTLL